MYKGILCHIGMDADSHGCPDTGAADGFGRFSFVNGFVTGKQYLCISKHEKHTRTAVRPGCVSACREYPNPKGFGKGGKIEVGIIFMLDAAAGHTGIFL